MNNQTISIDPSGTGTTSIFHCHKFYNLQKDNWIEHFNFIKMFIKDHNINKIYLETLKMIYSTTNHSLALIKLIGALQILFNDNKIQVITVTSDQTKRIVKWFKNLKYTQFSIENKHKISAKLLQEYDFCKKTQLTYIFQKGWFFQSKKITDHNRDSVLIYWIGKEKENENYN